MQYNVDNLFDTLHDPRKQDEDFTPDGRHQWTLEKLDEKLEHLGQIVKSIKNEDGSICPDILTLCEVKNAAVLERWKTGALSECNYQKIVISDNDPDVRGIKTALMTRLPIVSQPISHPVYRGGRFINEVKIQIDDFPLTVFTNHWKSRLTRPPDTDGGVAKRAKSAVVLRKRVDEILADDPKADILITGDLNDEPEDASVKTVFGITSDVEKMVDDNDQTRKLFWEASYDLLNTPQMMDLDLEQRSKAFKVYRSTFYYGRKKEYDQIDHFLLSPGLFDDEGFSYLPHSFQVVHFPAFTDKTLNRPIPYEPITNDSGDEKGERGASDHFPILLRLKLPDAN